MQPIRTIFLASGNPHKIEELSQVLEPMGIKLKSTLDYTNPVEVEEDQPDLTGNALKKAKFWHQFTGIPALADDTGLEVDVLDGSPGVYSARYAGKNVTYDENVNKLLKELENETVRTAQFRTVVAFVTDKDEHTFEGICRGKIINEKRGDGGFGYDPVFMPEGYTKTFAELNSREKNKISHRGRAVEKFISYLSGQ
jgi:XTP/dITP diphosphohydrolase